MLMKVRGLNLFKDVNVGRGDKTEEMTHMFLADDVLIYCETNKLAFLNLRCILMDFQVVSLLWDDPSHYFIDGFDGVDNA